MTETSTNLGRSLRSREVGDLLQASSAAVRRYASDFEAVFGPLPRDGDGRLWTPEAVALVERAKAELERGRARSLRAALAGLRGRGADEGAQAEPRPTGAGVERRNEQDEELLRLLLAGQDRLEARLEAVERSCADLLAALGGPAAPQARAGGGGESADARVRALERERDDLMRRLQHLEGELQRWWPWKRGER